jgi:putative peptide zinc metalloprotease protein
MSETLFSPSWYRVARLQPRLRCHVQIHRHHYRSQRWYVLQDHVSGRYHRFTPAAHDLIGLMDGERTVQELWELATERLGDDAPTQEEVIHLLSQLNSADALLCDVPPDSLELFQRYQRQQRLQWKQRLWSPMALRFPLWDPERFLGRWLPLAGPLFSGLGALLWLLVVGTAAILGAVHWQDLTDNLADWALAPSNLLLLWLVYPVVKACHELGHGFAVKRWGGEVHDLGIMLIVLMPVPYVDASAASAFRDKYKRMVVGAAGMLVELLLAAVALFVWLAVEPGVVRLVAHNVILIGTVSTLLFNGNPLLRYDGYYVLADAIEIPNLAMRSTRYFGYLVQRYLFGIRDLQSPATAPGERSWFVLYGIASLGYRLFITWAIILLVAGKFFIIGVILALWTTLTMIFVPLAKAMRFLFANPQLRRKRTRALVTSGLLLAGLSTVVLLPVPLWTRAEGVIWLPEQSQVHAGTDGFIQEILATPGAFVHRGDPLLRTEDPLLPAQVKVLEARLQELQVRYEAQWYTDRVQAAITKETMAVVQADLERARERDRELLIRSPLDGLFIVPQAQQDLPGRFVHQGELVAYVVNPTQVVTVRVVVSQDDIGLVRQRTRRVQIKLAGRVAETLPVVIQREVPAATAQLPSTALGSAGGGQIPIDPHDAKGMKAFQSIFQLDLQLPPEVQVTLIGSRIYVRFDQGSEPLAFQWYRLGRQLFLRRFGV